MNPSLWTGHDTNMNIFSNNKRRTRWTFRMGSVSILVFLCEFCDKQVKANTICTSISLFHEKKNSIIPIPNPCERSFYLYFSVFIPHSSSYLYDIFNKLNQVYLSLIKHYLLSIFPHEIITHLEYTNIKKELFFIYLIF